MKHRQVPGPQQDPPQFDRSTMTAIMVYETGAPPLSEDGRPVSGRLVYETTMSPVDVANALRLSGIVFSYGDDDHHINVCVGVGQVSKVMADMRRRMFPAASPAEPTS